jgi:hypothetical protein
VYATPEEDENVSDLLVAVIDFGGLPLPYEVTLETAAA